MSIQRRNNVKVRGVGARTMLFAHGFGCDQNMWRFVAPEFEDTHRVVVFDYVGAGQSDWAAYSRERYDSLQGYAEDVLDIAQELEIEDGIFVGHSVSAMIGLLACIEAPRAFSEIVMVGPSPRYLDDEGYVGGFARADIDGLLESIESNYLGWSAAMAPAIMGNADRPELGQELTDSFCRANPEIAKQFARVTFLSDNRADLPRLQARALVMQCSSDIIAPKAVGEYVHRMLPNNELVLMNATGHCPNLSAPAETVAVIRRFLRGSASRAADQPAP